MRKLFAFASALLLTFIQSSAFSADAVSDAKTEKTVKILVVGNSFSGNALKHLKDIVKSDGSCVLRYEHAMIGGCPLEKHFNLALKHEESPDAPEGKPYKMGGKNVSLKEMLQAEDWQYVSIQQYSAYSFKIDTYRPHAANLVGYILKYAPSAEILVHQTWAYREDSPLFKDGFTQASMYRELTTAYHTIAAEIGAKKIIPDGDAFQLARETPEWTFKRDPAFDYANPVRPALPKETGSLNAGYFWKEKDGKSICSLDANHANTAGEYLAGCVWFESLFGKDVRKVSFKPASLSEEQAASLREIARKVVSEGVKPKLWPEGLK